MGTGKRTIGGRTRRRRSKRGGASAWSFVTGQVGTPDVQARNALTIQQGDDLVSRQSNSIEQVGNLNAQNKLSGGRKRRNKRGGSWSATLNQALVPFSLWGMRYLTKSKRKGTKSTSSRRRKRSFKR